MHATYGTISKVKVDVMKERILSINRKCNVTTHQLFVTPENIEELVPDDVDYVIDAIDTVSAKIALAKYCYEKDINIIAVVCGIGKVNAAICTQILISEYKVSSIINVGGAGGIGKNIYPGDVVVGTDLV
ncbi:hypothetical protein GNF67_18965, partial [Clostridium perfringens]|nr:hypothetical protein [Clostridium perfringens]